MRVFERSFSTRQRIGEQRLLDARVRLWIVRDVLLSIRSLQDIQRAEVFDAPLEVLIFNLATEFDLRADVYGEPALLFETRQAISADRTALEDLRLVVYHPFEYFFDSSQDVLTQLADPDLNQVILGVADTSHDTQQDILELLTDTDTLQRVGLPVMLDGDLWLTITAPLVDADLLVEVLALLTDGQVQALVTGPLEFDADEQVVVAQWLGDRDSHQRIGEIVRQESHVIQ
jgi:hypothetical protein